MSRKKLYVSFLLVVLLSFLFSSSISAEYLGGKWANGRTVYFDVQSAVPSSYRTPAKNGGHKWNGIANITLRYRPDTTAQVVHIWVKPTKDDAYWTWKGYYAFGMPEPYGSSTYTWGTLEIVRGMMDNLTATKKTQVFVHEFGHLLGLAHTTKLFTSSVMKKSNVFKLSGPTSYDKEQLKGLYK